MLLINKYVAKDHVIPVGYSSLKIEARTPQSPASSPRIEKLYSGDTLHFEWTEVVRTRNE